MTWKPSASIKAHIAYPNSWRHCHHGDHTGRLCPECGEPLWVDKDIFGKSSLGHAACSSCGYQCRLAMLTAKEALEDALRKMAEEEIIASAMTTWRGWEKLREDTHKKSTVND